MVGALAASSVLLFVAARLATEDTVAPAVESLVVYGDAPSMFGRWSIPPTSDPAPVVVLVHGGFWRRQGGDLSLMAPLADDLVDRGYAVWNIEYGRTGERFGGWPHTFEHVEAAIGYLEVLHDEHPDRIDLGAVTVIGHSAGGHLALWTAGLDGKVAVRGVVGLAPIADLEAAASNALGNGAVSELLGGGPDAVPDRYRFAAPSPLEEVDVLVVVGGADDVVAERYSVAPDIVTAEFRRVPSAGHFDLIDPDGGAWETVVRWLEVGS